MSGHTKHYFKIYILLLVLFTVSVLGPELAEILDLTGLTRGLLVLITAFGIALVKAYYVCVHFMHLKGEKIYAPYILLTCLAMIFVFFFGTATDVMKSEGHNWTKTYVEPEPSEDSHHGGHGEAHGDEHVEDGGSHEGHDHH